MAFDYTKLQKSTQGDAIGVNTIWMYTKTDETLAAIAAAGYFNDVNEIVNGVAGVNYFKINDIIWIVGSDGATFSSVTAVLPDITTVAFAVVLGAGSVGTANIADGAVTTAKIAALAVDATKLAADAVTTAKILNANVTLAKLAAGIAPSHVIKYAGQLTTVGGAAAEAFAIAGAVAATDRAFVQIVDNGTNNVTALQAVVTANTLTVTFSANPGADCIFNYQLIRAAA